MSAGRKHSSGPPPLPLLLSVLLALGVFLGIRFWESRELQAERERLAQSGEGRLERLTVQFGGKWYVLRPGVDSCLLIGLDKTAERLENLDEDAKLNDLQSDFLMLLVADRKKESFTVLQLNRDAMASIPRIGQHGASLSPVTEQLALAHTYGSGGRDSCINTVKAVSAYLYGVPVDHYFSVTMDAVPILADTVGGVPVHIEDDFSPVTPLLPRGEDVTLRGELALTFVRSRKGVGDGSNLSRMRRQQAFMDSFCEKLRQKLAEDEGFSLRLFSELSNYMLSDLLTDELGQMAERLAGYDFTGIETVAGEAVQGERYMEFYAEEEALRSQVLRLFFEPRED